MSQFLIFTLSTSAFSAVRWCLLRSSASLVYDGGCLLNSTLLQRLKIGLNKAHCWLLDISSHFAISSLLASSHLSYPMAMFSAPLLCLAFQFCLFHFAFVVVVVVVFLECPLLHCQMESEAWRSGHSAVPRRQGKTLGEPCIF